MAAAVFVAVLYVYAHSFAAWSGARILPESSQQLDVVGLALHATCVVREAVAGLNAHVKPRRIYVVTKGDCETFTSFGPNVVCVLEDTLLPGFTKQDVAAALDARIRLGDEHAAGVYKGRSMSGWYYQQLLKMGAGRHIEGLSDMFLLWDMDMVPLRPLTLFERRARSDPAPPDGVAPILRTHRALLQVGGFVVGPYELSYARLFDGAKVEYAKDHSSFVVHHMLIYKPVMEEILQSIERLDPNAWTAHNETVSSLNADDVVARLMNATVPVRWPSTVLASANEHDFELGFSEYTTYASYALQRHADLYAAARRCTWKRYPYFSWISAAIRRYLLFDRAGPCCPSYPWLVLHRLLGFEFIGFEVGHSSALCLYDPAVPKYGL